MSLQPRSLGRTPTRKIHGPVKRERDILASPSNAVRKAAEVIAAPVTVADMTEMDESPSRRIRSGAPSLETRAHVTSHLGDDVTADDETEPILMEVRQRVKTSPGDDEEVEAPAQQNKSFASTHMAFQQMGQGLKAINDALGKLQTLGIQHVAHLPELVLVGDQSSGKSSLMSALANLNLPRSSSMCTRCPIHIRVSSGSRPWRCSVSLHKDYKLVGTTGDNLNMNNPPAGGSPYQGWRRMRQRDIQEFKTIEFTNDTVSADIERVIRWAQVAILNDHIDYHTYIPKISSEEGYNDNEVDMLENLDRFEGATLAKFSPNRVALEIRGPGLADMSFYDLPGVFSSRPNPDEQYLMKAVETLAAEYISHPSAIILWAVPMNIDPDNSVSFGLIQRANALNRCVAVLTKADLVPHTDHTPWIKFLKGETYRPGLGSHIIARPQRSDPDAYEESYFNRRTNAMNSNIGWPTDFAPFDDKCGVSRLKLTLSQKLGEEFSKIVPHVRRKIETKLRTLETMLKRYPDSPQNVELEIRQAIAQFTADVRQYLGSRARNDWADIQKTFSTQILQLKPKYIVKPPEEPYRVDASGVITLADTESVMSAASTPVKRRLPSEDVAGGPHATPAAKRRAGPNGVKLEEASPFVTPNARTGRRPGRTLRQLRQLIEARKNPGVPQLIPESVYDDLCREAVQPWNGPLETLVRDSTHTLNLQLEKILSRAFGKLEKRAIYKEVGRHVKAFVGDIMNDLRTDLQKIYRLETRQIFTMNTAGTKQNQVEERRVLDRHRHHFRCLAYLPNQGERPQLKDWSAMNDEEKSQEASKTAKELVKLGSDDYDSELSVAGYVRGYYLTAAARYVDTVLLHIISGLFPDMSDRIAGYLDTKLALPAVGQAEGAANGNRFDELMAEDQKDVEHRAFLKREQEKFNQAFASILSLEAPSAPLDTDATLVSDEEEADGIIQDEHLYMVDTQ